MDLVGECGEAEDVGSLGAAMLGLARLVPGAITFNEIDLVRRTATALRDPPELGGERSMLEFARLAHQNPLVVHGGEREVASAISDLLSDRSFRALELYDAVFAPLGFRDQIALHLQTSAERVAGIAINRERRGFSARDRAILELLAPHLRRVYRQVVERERHLAAWGLLAQGIGESGAVMVLIDPGGYLTASDPEAGRLLRHFFGAAADGDLPAPIREWLRAPRAALAVEDERGARLSVRLVERPGRPGWRALLLDRWGAGPTPAELGGLGLTPRESEALAWAARGLGDLAIGARMGISPRTVNKHLEHVYRKLDASGRTEAVAKALLRPSVGAARSR
jgi:DNA-binding CsgD family transcriptional regulator